VAAVEAVQDSATTVEPGKLIPIDEADTLPVPLTHRSPFYSTEAIQRQVSGTVIMNVLINDHGTVDQVVLVTGVTGGDVNDAAIRAAKSWTYRPATKAGVPVKVWRSEQVVVKP
jgi:TonB family protein